MKLSINMTLLVSAILFSACEGGTDRYWTIQNSSSEQLNIRFSSIYSGQQVEKAIESGKSEEILFTTNRGGSAQAGEVAFYLDSVHFTANSGDSVQKNVYIDSNWIIESEHARKIPSIWEHRFTFQVTDDDLN